MSHARSRGTEPAPTFHLDGVRREFPILQERAYLNSCSLGALSTRAEARLSDFLDAWHRMGAAAWYEHWLGAVETLRGRVAPFLGAETEELALLPSTSAALSVVAESVDYSRRPKVITTELDFPTVAYQWRVKPEAEVVVLPSHDGIGVDPEQFAQEVDERTAFLATGHVFFTTGFRQDLARLAEIAHDAGAYCLIDGYQGAGQVPVDARGSGVDFYTAGPLKWMCGGPGLAYLYVREGLVERLRPRITSWLAHQEPFAFETDRFRPRPDAGRFELGTPAVPTIHTALGGQEVLDEVGIEAIAAWNRVLTDRLLDGLDAAGLPWLAPREPEARTAIVMVQHPRAEPVVERLGERGIIVDHRAGYVRVSPHFYNTLEEVDRLVDELGRLSEAPSS